MLLQKATPPEVRVYVILFAVFDNGKKEKKLYARENSRNFFEYNV
nr:MAG TPA: hypothetical protein [Caudoviricetes sp.]